MESIREYYNTIGSYQHPTEPNVICIVSEDEKIRMIKKKFFNDEFDISCQLYVYEAPYRISGIWNEWKHFINGEEYIENEFFNKIQSIYELDCLKKKLNKINDIY